MDYTDRLNDKPQTGCQGDCNECEVYAFCWDPAPMEMHSEYQEEKMYDASDRLYP